MKILLIGDDCLDVYQYGTVDRISPEAPVPVFKMGNKEERPGMARNVKANLEELGSEVFYLSGRTSVKTRLIEERSRQQICRIDNDLMSSPLRITEIPWDISTFAKSTYSFTSGTLMSVKMVSLSGETSIYLRTNLTTPNYDYTNGEYGLSDVLAKIPIIVPPYATIVFQDVGASLFNSYIQTNSLGMLNIRLTNSEDIDLEFQDEWTCAFKVETYEATKEAEILGELKNLTEINKLNLLQKTIR